MARWPRGIRTPTASRPTSATSPLPCTTWDSYEPTGRRRRNSRHRRPYAGAGPAQSSSRGRLTPREARLHCTLGLALLELADHEAARQAFDCALDLDAGLSAALVNRAVAACELGDYAAAVTDLTAALETDPRDPDLLYNRGFVQEAAGQPEEAIADYTLALADPRADRPALLYQRGRGHAALGLRAAAHDDLTAHLALGDSPNEKEIRELLST